MTRHAPDPRRVVRSAIEQAGVESAVIFAFRPGSPDLELVAAAGIEGPPLQGLAAAVRNPEHPISRTVVDGAATYDVRPTAPGGPALRSHLPIIGRDAGRRAVLGVLAVAHRQRLGADARRVLEGLAGAAAALLDQSD
jgi:hypothetical protein